MAAKKKSTAKRKPNKPGPKGPKLLMNDADFNRFKQMIRVCCTREEICGIFEISESVLIQRLAQRGIPSFEHAISKYGAEGKMSLRRMQYKKAMAGNTQMLIWLGKQMLGQMDKVDNTSSDGTMSPPKKIIVRGVKPQEMLT